MADTSVKSLKEERQRYLILIVSGVVLAFLIALLANFVFAMLTGIEPLIPQGMYWLLIAISIVAALLSLILFFFAVSPRRIDREFLMLLVYDLDKEGFPLDFDYKPFFQAEAFRSSVQSDDNIQNAFRKIPKLLNEQESQAEIQHVERLLLQLSQAVLLSWLWHFGMSSVPLTRMATDIALPLPTKTVTKQVPSSYLRLRIGSAKLDHSGFDNPFVSQSPLLAEPMLPKGSQIKLSERGILLKNKRWKLYPNLKASADSRSCWKASPSELTKQWILSLAKKLEIGDPGSISIPRKYVELGFAIRFTAVVGRLANDIYVKWASEMAEDLERYLHWDTFIDNLREAS